MSNQIKDLKFDKCADEEVGSNQSTTYSLDDSSNESLLGIKKSTSDKKEFRFGSCTICLSDFEPGENVKQVPACKHTFHSECLEKWLIRKFTCPNCNLEIKLSNC